MSGPSNHGTGGSDRQSMPFVPLLYTCPRRIVGLQESRSADNMATRPRTRTSAESIVRATSSCQQHKTTHGNATLLPDNRILLLSDARQLTNIDVSHLTSSVGYLTDRCCRPQTSWKAYSWIRWRIDPAFTQLSVNFSQFSACISVVSLPKSSHCHCHCRIVSTVCNGFQVYMF